MEKSKPSLNISKLALNLDGCRFGDENENRHPNNNKLFHRRRHHHGYDVQEPQPVDHQQQQQQQQLGQTQKEQHPDQQEHQQEQEQHSIFSPLSTHHRHHLPQYYNTTPSTHNNDNYDHPPTPQGGTYRFDNLSIGTNFLRHNGTTYHGPLSQPDESKALDSSSLIMEECVGRGNCSSVWKARCRRRRTHTTSDDNELARGLRKVDEGATSTDDSLHDENNGDSYINYAIKFFSLRTPEKRSMLLRELKLLCTFHCDCLVELQGAFLDVEYDEHGNTVALVLEYMDCGSLADLIANGSGGGDLTDDEQRRSNNHANRHHQSGKEVKSVPEYVIASIAYQILWGLSYLHYEGVLHRDIKVRRHICMCVHASNFLSRSRS